MGVKLGFFVVSGDHSLRVFGNRVLKKMFGPKRKVVTGEWRTTHIIRVISSKERDGRDMWHLWGYLHIIWLRIRTSIITFVNTVMNFQYP